MLTLKLYKYSGKNNVVSKVLDETTAHSENGVFFDYFDTITPQVKVRTKTALNDLKTFNYCFIAALENKYYFVENVVILSSGVYRFDLRLDVLKTYENEIKAATATINAKDNANKYLSNRETVTDRRPYFQKIDFSVNAPFDENGTIIMITLRGN